MIRFDDQPPMSPAADEWANSALEKSEKYIDKKISKLSYYGENKHQRIYELPKNISKQNIFIFYIHGGAWEFGYPEWVLFTYDYFKNYNINLIAPGYRLSPKFKFVDQIKDITDSINFIKKKYGEEIKIVISGHSAGAHLAYYASKEIKVNGLMLSSGVYDLTTYTKKYVEQITDSAFTAKSISPIFDSYNTNTPILLTYSSAEEKVYITQSENFYNKIKNKNIKNKNFIFNNTDHYHELNAMNKNNLDWDNIFCEWLNSLI
jgi:acetyl esterase/lipase